MQRHVTSLMALAFFALGGLSSAQDAHAWTFPLPGGHSTLTNPHWSCNRICFHLGDDLLAPAGTDVISVGNGRVVEVTYRGNQNNYGGRVLVEYTHPVFGTVVVLYGHLGRDTNDPATDSIFVQVGDLVVEGQVMGKLGDRSENGGFVPHLHFSVNRGPYHGNASECGAWRYAGYTARRYDSSEACYCNVLDNWIDPQEFLGLAPKQLRIAAGNVTPPNGVPGSTEHRWYTEVYGGFGAPITALVLITNPVTGAEFPFTTSWAGGNNPARFEYRGRLQDEGTYGYRFVAQTCADSVEEATVRSGPVSALRCTPQTEICDGVDNDCDGEVDEGTARPEVCDGADNDCDGEVDEGTAQACSTRCETGVRECVGGVLQVCDARQPGPETCNGIDDDCDGQTDEGVLNACGQCGPVPAEVCDGVDNDCDGAVDEYTTETCSSACGAGVRACVGGVLQTCSARQPAPETCNGIDDDCDGQTDEGLLNACGQCGTAPVETCNGRDDDCDGQIDEGIGNQACNSACGNGTRSCINGMWSACSARQPTTETCNDIDDDCNGQVDDLPPRACTASPCGATGTQPCTGGTWGACSANCPPPPPPPPTCTPSAEVCDGVDNDCDGDIDEGTDRDCTTACGTGREVCRNGSYQTCTADAPQPETCNFRDDDCNGQVDDLPPQSCTASGGCGLQGVRTCITGQWSDCSVTCPPACTPSTEVCDGVDNDCNGLVDENVTRACTATPCNLQGIETCGNGQWSACSVSCPDPPPPPRLYRPNDGEIDEQSVGTTPRITLRWYSAANATDYEWHVLYGDGTVAAQGSTANQSAILNLQRSDYGRVLTWRVRGIGIGGTGNWSDSRQLTFSYTTGVLIGCNDSSCPSRNACYQVSRDTDSSGTEPRLILDWVSASCLNGRSCSFIPYSEMQGYARRAPSGCP